MLGVTVSLLDFSSSSICLRILLIFHVGCYTFVTGFFLFFHLLKDIVDFPFWVLHFHYWIFALLPFA